MNDLTFLIGVDTPALGYTKAFLEANGCRIASEPTPDVTHLVLNVPTFSPDGSLIGGSDLSDILSKLPDDVTVIGGNLNVPILQSHCTQDLLQNEAYLAENAAITAECALRVALIHFPAVIRSVKVLITGWGRIAKCLAKLMNAAGANVTVAARNEADIAISSALGYRSIPINRIPSHIGEFRIIFNTVPAMILPDSDLHCRSDCVKIDLASKPGIAGSNVISARGLPGKMTPETAGHLIAKTILELPNPTEVSS